MSARQPRKRKLCYRWDVATSASGCLREAKPEALLMLPRNNKTPCAAAILENLVFSGRSG